MEDEDFMARPPDADSIAEEDEVAAAGRETIEKMRLLRRILGTRILKREDVSYPRGGLGRSLEGHRSIDVGRGRARSGID